MRGKSLFDDGDKHVLVDPEAILYAVREERVIRIWTAEGQRITSKSTRRSWRRSWQVTRSFVLIAVTWLT